MDSKHMAAVYELAGRATELRAQLASYESSQRRGTTSTDRPLMEDKAMSLSVSSDMLSAVSRREGRSAESSEFEIAIPPDVVRTAMTGVTLSSVSLPLIHPPIGDNAGLAWEPPCNIPYHATVQVEFVRGSGQLGVPVDTVSFDLCATLEELENASGSLPTSSVRLQGGATPHGRDSLVWPSKVFVLNTDVDTPFEMETSAFADHMVNITTPSSIGVGTGLRLWHTPLCAVDVARLILQTAGRLLPQANISTRITDSGVLEAKQNSSAGVDGAAMQITITDSSSSGTAVSELLFGFAAPIRLAAAEPPLEILSRAALQRLAVPRGSIDNAALVSVVAASTAVVRPLGEVLTADVRVSGPDGMTYEAGLGYGTWTPATACAELQGALVTARTGLSTDSVSVTLSLNTANGKVTIAHTGENVFQVEFLAEDVQMLLGFWTDTLRGQSSYEGRGRTVGAVPVGPHLRFDGSVDPESGHANIMVTPQPPVRVTTPSSFAGDGTSGSMEAQHLTMGSGAQAVAHVFQVGDAVRVRPAEASNPVFSTYVTAVASATHLTLAQQVGRMVVSTTYIVEPLNEAELAHVYFNNQRSALAPLASSVALLIGMSEMRSSTKFREGVLPRPVTAAPSLNLGVHAELRGGDARLKMPNIVRSVDGRDRRMLALLFRGARDDTWILDSMNSTAIVEGSRASTLVLRFIDMDTHRAVDLDSTRVRLNITFSYLAPRADPGRDWRRS